MDSINQQQPEENQKDLAGSEAGKKIKELAEKSNTCYFCTKIITGEPLKTRPMSVQKVGEDGNFWVVSLTNSYLRISTFFADGIAFFCSMTVKTQFSAHTYFSRLAMLLRSLLHHLRDCAYVLFYANA